MRLDRALVVRDLARSRAEAQALIEAGQVTVGGKTAGKASQAVDAETELAVLGARMPYASRAGSKLEAALVSFSVDVAGRRCLDVGASTGGFTDCLLQRGAARVVAIDVGHGQMALHLAADPRVDLREGVNARALSPSDFDVPFDVIAADLSFISLTLVLPALSPLLHRHGDLLCLVKPQFEVGAGRLDKGGVVRDPAAHQWAVERVAAAAAACGLQERGRRISPLTGAAGNREFLLWLTPTAGRYAPRVE